MGGTATAQVSGRDYAYEVWAFAEERWAIVGMRNDEGQAVDAATLLLADEKNSKVKVVRLRSVPGSGFNVESVVFEQSRAERAKNRISLSAKIDEAPPCAEMDDFYALPARAVMNRMFRQFLDRLVVTPTELLHNYSYFKKLDSAGSIVAAAVHQIAQAQAKAGQGSPTERMAALNKLLREATTLARDALAERKRMPRIEENDFAAFLRRVEARFEEKQRRHVALTMLSEHLSGSRSWGQKLEQVAPLFDGDVPPHGLAMLDGVVADILGAGAMVQELLGEQPNLGAALGLLIDLATGRLAAAPEKAPESFKLVHRLIADKGMPESRQVLFDRAVREIKTPKRLNRGDDELERAALDALVAKLKDDSGKTLGGEEVDKAIARRNEDLRRALLAKAGVIL